MAANRFANYDVNAVDIVLCNIPILEGRVKGSFLKISPDNANWGTVQDCSGLVSRYRTNNRLYTIELTLHQTSVHHAQLSAAFAADHLATNGAGVGNGLVKDNNGASLYTFPQVWVEKQPDFELGEEVKEFTWVFKGVSDPQLTITGGN